MEVSDKNEVKVEDFKRSHYHDLQFDWYGYDSFGNIAQFIAGTLPVPSRIFKNKNEYSTLANYFRNLPKITKSHLTKRFETQHRNIIWAVLFGGSNYDTFLRTAKTGVFSIYETYEGDFQYYENFYYEGCYHMIAMPLEPLSINSLPENIKELIKPYYFQVNFADIDKIDIAEFIECDF